MSEVWKAVPGFEGVYEVSDLGTIRSLDRRVWSARGFWAELKGRVLSPGQLRAGGHLHVYLKHDGKRASRLVHRVVLEAFVGPCPDGLEACHADGDPTNNALTNLRWDSRSANQRDAVRHGTHASTRKTHCPKGHPYSPENTRMYRGGRRCRECGRRASLRWWHEQRSVAALQAGGAS